MIPALTPELIFQQTGLWMWLVHMGMSAVFAALLGGFHFRLRRPVTGWLARFFLARAVFAGMLAAYWGGALTSPLATFFCAVVMGSALTFEVPQVIGAARALRGLEPINARVQRFSAMVGAAYGASVVLILMRMVGQTDLVASLQFRPLIISATVLMALAVSRGTDEPIGRQSVLRFLRLGVYGLLVCLLGESVLRIQVSLSGGQDVLLTGTVVANLLGLLVMGISSILAVIADERAEMEVLMQRETQLSRQQAEASRLESLGRMASGIAHDFNRVLAIVAGTVDLVRGEWRTNPDGAIDDIATMRRAADRGSRLTRRLMILAKQGGSDLEVFRPVDVVSELVPLVAGTLEPGRQISIAATSLASVRMSQTQFEQIVLNLVINAHDATPVDGAITVAVADHALRTPLEGISGSCVPGDWICLVVEDNGSGIEPQLLPHLFDPFVSTKGDGSFGVGMMTVQQAVSSAGGQIRIDSKAGRGTRMEVWLPVCHQLAAGDESRGIDRRHITHEHTGVPSS
jgi:signal transduction histidine kinase